MVGTTGTAASNGNYKIPINGDVSDYTGGTHNYGYVKVGGHGTVGLEIATSGSAGNAPTKRLTIDHDGHIKAGTDSAYDIGTNATRFRNLYVDTLYGDGSNLTGITQTNNNADNRVITGGSGANLNGESNLTFDGTSMVIGGGSASNILDLGTATMNRGISWGGASNNYVNIWAEYGSGSLWLGAGLKPKTNSFILLSPNIFLLGIKTVPKISELTVV